jgi:DNA polymerase III subunit epsilon
MRFVDCFHRPWGEVPIVMIDTETTGPVPGADRAVQVGLVRFEGGVVVGEFEALVAPGKPISAQATEVHGLTDADVADAPAIESVFALDTVQALLRGAQPGAYNASFDRWMVPPIGDDAHWPWLDALPLVREVDRWVKGKGRHRLETAAKRHGVVLEKAHSALADAKAAGQLFFKLARGMHKPDVTLGELLYAQRVAEAEQWADFQGWLAKQPPQAALPGV